MFVIERFRVPNLASHHATEVLVGSGSARAREEAARERAARVAGAIPGLQVVDSEDVRSWAFQRFLGSTLPVSGPLLIRTHQLHQAFPTGQTGSTRLVLTQSGYQLQRWLDWMDLRGNVSLIADADAAALRRAAPEAWQSRGPWSRITLVELPERDERNERNEREPPEHVEPFEHSELLFSAFITEDPSQRLALCRRAVDTRADDPVTHLALGSACMEVQDLDASAIAIERAVALAPDWEAAHYELGKLFLRRDDMERASTSFAEAGRLMPSFSAAFSNLGATLGELDRPKDALRAFEQALKYDPNGYTILNNIGVVSRELGSLRESEAAFLKVVALAPEFVFGHYNLGHTLFLQGRYQAALSAYTEGQRRDPERNARQACRLAVVRLAAGDAEGSLRDLQRCTASLPGDQKREILAEAQEILWALLTDQPALPGWRDVADAVKAELERI
jgi:tetratricopeptide (TPR) repeat protein